MPVQPPSADLVDKLVYASRILYDHGVVDGLGHASVWHDSVPDVFLLSCNRAPAMVRRRDIVCYDLAGGAVSETTEWPYSNGSSKPRSTAPVPTSLPWCTAVRPA